MRVTKMASKEEVQLRRYPWQGLMQITSEPIIGVSRCRRTPLVRLERQFPR